MKNNIAPPALLRHDAKREVWIEEGIYVYELLNHPAHPQSSLARCRLPAFHITRNHQLTVDETYIIESGVGEMQVGGEIFDVKAGDSIHIPKGTSQNIENKSNDDLIFLALCIPAFTPNCYTAI